MAWKYVHPSLCVPQQTVFCTTHPLQTCLSSFRNTYICFAGNELPSFTVTPYLNTSQFTIGDFVHLECCSSDVFPTVQWIQINGYLHEKAVGLYDTDLLIPNVEETDLGMYACIALNINGFIVSDTVNVTSNGEGNYSL